MTGGFEDIIGKKVLSFALEDNKQTLSIAFMDGTTKKYGVEGDCCSHSWIEHLEMPDTVAGATLTAVEDSDYTEVPDPDHECLKVYRVTFQTTLGSVTLEFRNSSNGYYGGYLIGKNYDV